MAHLSLRNESLPTTDWYLMASECEHSQAKPGLDMHTLNPFDA